MPLKPGDRLGSYEILAPIGAGGMGEVYRARDARLGRDVAVKVLPEAFARDADRMRRFEQEARAVAALSHPNVLAVFDTGMKGDVPYLVSELLEGENFRGVLAEGAIPARKAVEYARQIAGGLAAAHEKKIVHRDLKPENLFLTGDGRVKILDFGLAKLPAQESAAAADGATATLAAVTGAGVVMGTNGYMAPEQVRGEAVDHRADIFSFGATLYEMLSGRRAFQGESSVETLNAILKEDPPEWDAENLRVPPGLERVVRHCLEKKPADRFQSARDLMFALATMTDAGVSTPSRGAAVRSPRRWLIPAAALLLAAIAAGAGYWGARRSAPVERIEFAIAVPGEVSHLALSPDGKWLAFVAPGETDSNPMVWVQRVGGPPARAIPETVGASYPFWSPDDLHVAFFAKGKLQRVPAAGGAPQNLATVGIAARGGSWGRSGVLLYTPDSGGPIWRVNADGSGAAAVTEKLLRAGESSHRWPVFLPDGDHFLMFAGSFSEKQDRVDGIYLSSLAKSEKTMLVPARCSGGYAAGKIYYVDDNGILVAAPVDIAAARVTGAPQAVAGKTARSPSTYYGSFSVSENSTVIYSAESATNHSQLTWFDENGKETGRAGPISVMANPSLSPDGKRVAWDSNDLVGANVDVWLLEFTGGGLSRFTFDPSEEVGPVWSRDGTTIAYRTLRNAMSNIELKKSNGLGVTALPAVGNSTNDIVPTSWAPDDRAILCTFQTSKSNCDLVLVPVDGGKARTFLTGPANKVDGQISPDGKWVAYASNESGDWEIYVTTFPGANGKWQVSRGGGTEPRWRRDGKAIFYIGAKQMLTEAAVSTEGTFGAAATRTLFPVRSRPPNSSTDVWSYDVTGDGKRFLVNQAVKPERAPPINIVLEAGAK